MSNGADKCDISQQGKLVYLPVRFGSNSVSALLDSGSTINIISSKFYQSLGSKSKSALSPSENPQVKLANGQYVNILGTTRIHMQLPDRESNSVIPVFVLQELSHPIILGTQFLMSLGIVLDFKSMSVYMDSYSHIKVRNANFVTLPPHSSMIVEAKIPKHVSIGLTGVCLPSEAMMNRGLMVAKSVALVDIGHTMPVKVLNVSDKNVNIGRNNVIAYFEPLNDHVISNLSENDALNMCANVCVNNTGGESSESLENL